MTQFDARLHYLPPQYPGAQVRSRSNHFGSTALALGVIAVATALVPAASFMSFVLALVAVTFGVLGAAREGARKRESIVGLLLGFSAPAVPAVMVTILPSLVASGF